MRDGSRLRVHLPRLEHNYQALRRLSPKQDILFMVKANAYGHGTHPITSFAHAELGIGEFGCATLGEALDLRQAVEGEFEIYVLSDIHRGLRRHPEVFAEHRLLAVIASLDDLDVFLSKRELARCPLCLKFNTGMNRLGIPHAQAERVAARLQRAGRKSVAHLMSHYACAPESMESHPLNVLQGQNFAQVKEVLQDAGVTLEKTSIACSAAIEQGAGLSESHIRPGLMLYGPGSVADGTWPGKVISDLETLVIATFDIDEGQPVGYGASRCPRKGTLAVIALGYGDGFVGAYRGLRLRHKGQTGEVVGRVNMDMAQVLFDRGADIRAGQTFVLWGEDRREFECLAQNTGLSPYELFCQIGPRIPREY